VDRFVWVFYLFGAFLVYTAITLARQQLGGEQEFKENAVIRWSRRIFPPTAIVMIAIGTTDLIFALDSIPAIFGLTTQAYIVFTANAFALMGLRQMYFLLGGLLDRLVYLSYGLAAVLAFIGVKLVLDALHGNNVPFINGGEPVEWAPHVPIWLSLTVIVVVLGVATIASLAKSAKDARADSA
jgi:tellurite resistance protein TerC